MTRSLLIEKETVKRARRLLFNRSARNIDLSGDTIETIQASVERSSLSRTLLRAGIPFEKHRYFYLRWILEIAFCLILTVVAWNYYPAFSLLLILFLERLSLCRKVWKRSIAFERDYPTLLVSLASAIRTGLDPLVALAQSGQMFQEDSEVAQEIKEFSEDLERGVPEEDALRHFAETIDHPDIDLFRTAMILSRKQGSSLSQCLQRLARVTRQRQSFRRRIRSSVAMQKVSAWGIAGCTVVIGVIQYVSNPDMIHGTLANPVGSKIMMTGGSLILIGLIWMRRLAGRI